MELFGKHPTKECGIWLNTCGDLCEALDKPGFLVVVRKPGGKSRIHRTSCFVFDDVQKLGGVDDVLGQGEARQRYYHCESWDDAVKKWSELLTREPIPCRNCRPGPEV